MPTTIYSQNWDSLTPPATAVAGMTYSDGNFATQGFGNSAPNSLTNNVPANVPSAFHSTTSVANVRVTAAVLFPAAIGNQLILQCHSDTKNFNTSANTYFVVIDHAFGGGIDGVRLGKKVASNVTYLTGYLGGTSLDDNVFYLVSLSWNAGTLAVQVQRTTDSKYLKPDGTWQVGAIDVASVADSDIPAAGYEGVTWYNVNSTGGFIDDLLIEDIGAGTPSVTISGTTGTTTATVVASANSGTAPYSYAWHRSTSHGFTPGPGNLVGGDTATLNDTGLSNDTDYFYVCIVTDDAAQSATSDELHLRTVHVATTYYVDLAGSDSNSGTTTGTAWQTIDKVNAWTFVAGDTIRFKGGATFSGNLVIAESGTRALPITVNSYSSGNAIISCGDGDGVQILNSQYVSVSHLTITGSGVSNSGVTTSTGSGVNCRSTAGGSTPYYGIVLDNLTISGCRQGVLFGIDSTSGRRGYSGAKLTNLDISRCAFAGIYTWVRSTTSGTLYDFPQLSPGELHSNFYLYRCYVHDVYGSTSGTTIQDTLPGSGIRLCNMNHALIDQCVVRNVGHGGDGISSPAGVESEYCSYITLRSSEVDGVVTANGIDGMGVDLWDGGTHHNTIEYCYLHDNDGAGIGGGGSDYGVARFNVSQNNNRYGDAASSQYGEFANFGTLDHMEIYNNVFYNNRTGTGPWHLLKLGTMTNSRFANNVFVAAGSNDMVDTNATGSNLAAFVNNCYSWNGGAFSITVNGTEYTSLADWQAAGQEMLNANAVGLFDDPDLTAPTATTALLPTAAVSTLTKFDSLVGSPLRGAGLNPLTELGLDFGPYDLHVRAISATTAFDIGAHQSGATSGGGGTFNPLSSGLIRGTL